MNLLGLSYLLVAHFFSGRGVLRLFKAKLPQSHTACLSMIIGVAALSFVPCFLQLVKVPITSESVSIGIGALTCLLIIPLPSRFKFPVFKKLVLPHLYEWPFIVVLGVLMVLSIWRCFYFPPLSRDMLSGPELIAEYTVREHTMINSVFSIDLSTTNNYFKSPFITGLQIIYKLLVCPFGQLWLSVVFVSFTLWLYSLMRSFIHPLIGGLLMLFFISSSDLYAYSFLILYDYSNAVFFFCGFYFLYRYAENKQVHDLTLSAFLFGLATYIRTETLVLVIMMAPLLFVIARRSNMRAGKALLYTGVFIMASAIFYFLCMNVFIRNFVPIPFDVASQVNPHLADVSVFFTKIWDISADLIFSGFGAREYGYFIFLFCGLLILDLCWIRRFNHASLIALYGIVVVYVGLAFLGYLLPLFDLENTTKRGLFKILPLMLFYMFNSGVVLRLTAVIRKWEEQTKQENRYNENG